VRIAPEQDVNTAYSQARDGRITTRAGHGPHGGPGPAPRRGASPLWYAPCPHVFGKRLKTLHPQTSSKRGRMKRHLPASALPQQRVISARQATVLEQIEWPMDWVPFWPSLTRIEPPRLSPTSLPHIYFARTQAKSGGSAASSQQRKRIAGRSTPSSTSSISAESNFKVNHQHPSPPTHPDSWMILAVDITNHLMHDSDSGINRLDQPFLWSRHNTGGAKAQGRSRSLKDGNKRETPSPHFPTLFSNPIVGCGAARHVG
jgi:hypothetical protein